MKSNEDLAREIAQLKEEVQQMKEMVSMLLNLVVDHEDDGGEEGYLRYSGLSTSRDFKLNN